MPSAALVGGGMLGTDLNEKRPDAPAHDFVDELRRLLDERAPHDGFADEAELDELLAEQALRGDAALEHGSQLIAA